jgi:molybdopterin biosynthesis enzyme
MLTYEQALEKLLAAAQPVEEVRHVPLLAAAGRVLAVVQQSPSPCRRSTTRRWTVTPCAPPT